MIFAGKSRCAICGQVLMETDAIVGLPAIADTSNALYKFFDEGFHASCFENWDKKEEAELILQKERTERDKHILTDLYNGNISEDVFIRSFSVNVKQDAAFVTKEIRTAIESQDPEEMEKSLLLLWLSGDITKYIDTLNELLVNPHHRSHQQIAKALQDEAPSASTIPFVRKALESNFDYLQYTCSESGSIAKWFSWLLFSIGTKEAIDLMKEYADSPDEGIANEMRNRLKKVNAKT